MEMLKWGAGGIQALQAEKMDAMQSAKTMADTAKTQQEIKQVETDNAIKQKASEMMRETTVGKITSNQDGTDAETPTSMSEAFRQTGNKLIKLGFTEKGMEYHKNASTLNKDESDANKTRLDQQKAE